MLHDRVCEFLMQHFLVLDTLVLNLYQIVKESVAIALVRSVSDLLVNALFTQIFVNQVLFCNLGVVGSQLRVIKVEAKTTF